MLINKCIENVKSDFGEANTSVRLTKQYCLGRQTILFHVSNTCVCSPQTILFECMNMQAWGLFGIYMRLGLHGYS